MRIWLQGRRMLTRQMGAVRKKNTLRETARRIRSIILPDDEAGRRGPRNRMDVSFPFEFNPDGRTTFHFTLPAVTAEEIGIPVMPHGLAQSSRHLRYVIRSARAVELPLPAISSATSEVAPAGCLLIRSAN